MSLEEHVANGDMTETGSLAPGNRWMMPRWQPGQSGRPAKYTPHKLWYAVKEYVETHTSQNELRILNKLEPKRLTWAGLANHLGITRQSLDSYAKGDIGKTDDHRAGVSAILAQYRTLMESELEDMLTSKAFATEGVKFALKNQNDWRDEKHLNVKSEEKQRLIIEVPEALANKIEHARTIEGEVIDSPESTAQ